MNYQPTDTNCAIAEQSQLDLGAGEDGLDPPPRSYPTRESPIESDFSSEPQPRNLALDESLAQERKLVDPSNTFDHHQHPSGGLMEGSSGDQSKPPSVGSHDFQHSHLASLSHQFQTPRGGENARNDGKSSSTFENSDQQSTTRGNQGNTSIEKRPPRELERNSSVILEEPSDKSQEQMKEQTLSRQLSGDNNYDLQGLNSSTQKDSRNQRESVRRLCRDKTSKYSLTHKGMQSNIQTSDENSTNQIVPQQSQAPGQPPQGLTSRQLSFRRGSQLQHSENPIDHNRLDGEEEILNRERSCMTFNPPQKKGSKPTYEQCVASFQDMLAFDWSLKDINNLRHSPQQEMTSSIYWFYISCLYFPARALHYSQMDYSQFCQSFLKWLDPSYVSQHWKLKNTWLAPEPCLPQDINQSIQKYEDQQEKSKELQDEREEEIKESIFSIENERHTPEAFQVRVKDFQIPAQDEQMVDQHQPVSQPEECSRELQNPEVEIVPASIQVLFKDRKMRKFKKLFKNLEDRTFISPISTPKKDDVVVEWHHEIVAPKTDQNSNMEDDNVTEQILEEENVVSIRNSKTKEEEHAERKLSSMIELLLADLNQIETSNKDSLEKQFNRMKEAFTNALEADQKLDPEVYTYMNMDRYNLNFLSSLEPIIVQDMYSNQEWYQENCNEILLNVGLPTKLEKDFLRHIEQVQQKKSDLKYRKILKNMEQKKEGTRGGEGKEAITDHHAKGKRQQANQEDAQCAICNNGDYEEEDMIVFCSFCSIPVHQACYGIEKVPEGDWICNNCEIYGMKTGLLVECMLCPKRGGAMKPTNLFTNNEYWKKYNTSNSSNVKKSKKSSISKANLQSQSAQDMSKSIPLGNEDKNLSLHVIIQREYDFQLSLRNDSKRKQEYEFVFDGSEQSINDYSFFLHSNEAKMLSYPSAQTLYKWVHLSCACWLPGTQVTPKTPVRLNKFEEKRFSLPCIICLKAEGSGACMQCQSSRCNIAFHVECARRASYYLEIEKKEGSRDKTYKLFCEKHRPLKIVKEIAERDRQTIEEIHKFCKIIEKCKEIDARYQAKPKRSKGEHSEDEDQKQEVTTKKQHPGRKGGAVSAEKKRDHASKMHDKSKKWREKDKKKLFESIKDKYLLLRRLRITVVRVDPGRKMKKPTTRKRSKKRDSKKQTQQQHRGGCRSGLRSTHSNINQQLNPDEEEKQDMTMEQSKLLHTSEKMNDEIEDDEDNLEAAGSMHTSMRGHMNEEMESSQMGQTDKDKEQTMEQVDQVGDEEVFFKIAIPSIPAEMDWMITLSTNDFPWHEIKFPPFTARECYEKYVSVVKDPQTFLKKVLGNKDKFKKMMQSQLALHVSLGLTASASNQAVGSGQSQSGVDNSMYCTCKGAINSEFYVMCDGDQECPNGGWMHPQCTNDLSEKPKQEIDDLQSYYCEDCRARIHNEEKEDQEIERHSEDLSEMAIIEAEDGQAEEEDAKLPRLKPNGSSQNHQTEKLSFSLASENGNPDLLMMDELGCEEEPLQREPGSSSRRSSSSSSSSSFDE